MAREKINIQDLNGFSKRLRELRKQKNLSQAQLGEMIGTHFTHISQYERGLSRPSMEKLKRLAEVLDVSSDYLLEGSTDDAARTTFEDRDFMIMFKEAEQLPEEERNVIKKLLDAFLTKHKIQKMVLS